MKTILFKVLIILIPSVSFAQRVSIKESIFFASNKSELSENGKKILDALIDSIGDKTKYSITVKGNTDNVGDSLYNIKLSEKRIQSVKDYMVNSGISAASFLTTAHGENIPLSENESDKGKQKNRRVDINVTYIIPEKIPVPQQESTTPKDTCKKDTTIYLPQGTQLIFNACEYKRIKKCLDLDEMLTLNDMVSRNQTTMTTNGQPLFTCGMTRIGVKAGCDASCFQQPVIVRFPVPEAKECDICRRDARMFNVGNGGNWNEMRGSKNQVRVIKINGKEFYEIKIYCPEQNYRNCDCLCKDCKKVKFKTNAGSRITEVKIGVGCPAAYWVYTPKKGLGRKANKVNTYISCSAKDVVVSALVTDKKGHKMEMKLTPIDDLQKKYLFPRCGKSKDAKVVTKILGIFPYKERKLYRKYYIKNNVLVKEK